MIAKITELLGGSEQAVRIARKLTHLTIEADPVELAWIVSAIDAALKFIQQMRRAA